MPSALEDAIDDGFGEVVIVEHGTPLFELLVGREDHGSVLQVPLVDDMEQHVRRVGAVGEVSDLVDDKHIGPRVGGERLAHAPLATRGRKVVDERCSGDEERVEPVLDRSVGEGDREVSFTSTRLSGKDESTPFGDEVGG